MSSEASPNSSGLSRWKPMIWMRQMYHWVMGWADHPQGTAALCGLATIESIIFPLPVDPLLVAMGAAKPKRALYYGFLTSLFSVIGAFGGYFIGLMFWDVAQEFFFTYIFSQDKFDFVIRKFQENGTLTMFTAAFTPLPFKVFTISAGVAQLSLIHFFLGATIGRSIRFMTISFLLFKYGAKSRVWIEKHFEKLTLAVGALVILVFLVYMFGFNGH